MIVFWDQSVVLESNQKIPVILTERGLTIAGTRITLYDVIGKSAIANDLLRLPQCPLSQVRKSCVPNFKPGKHESENSTDRSNYEKSQLYSDCLQRRGYVYS